MGIVELLRTFPSLPPRTDIITSPPTRSYNCIAWAARDSERCWWPADGYYWPPDAPRATTIPAFIEAFRSLGYEVCATGDLEPGLEKVALYANQSTPTHAARQLPDGFWTSKLGELEDIRHVLEQVEGDSYGHVVKFLSREAR